MTKKTERTQTKTLNPKKNPKPQTKTRWFSFSFLRFGFQISSKFLVRVIENIPVQYSLEQEDWETQQCQAPCM